MNDVMIISKAKLQEVLEKSFNAGYSAAVKQLQYQTFVANELPCIIAQAKAGAQNE